MQINRSSKFLNELFLILEYIAKDKLSASENFIYELDLLIEDLPNFPYKYKQSIYFDDKNIREMTYKGYTVIYKIDTDKNRIDIISIFNRNKPAN